MLAHALHYCNPKQHRRLTASTAPHSVREVHLLAGPARPSENLQLHIILTHCNACTVRSSMSQTSLHSGGMRCHDTPSYHKCMGLQSC